MYHRPLQVLSYFDPDNDGVVRLQELHSALRKLDLGLSRSQLNQLVLSLGYTLGDEEVEPSTDSSDSSSDSGVDGMLDKSNCLPRPRRHGVVWRGREG